jgi:hypothetical protein
VVTFVINEDLRFVRQPPECGRMDDPVAVAAESGSGWTGRLGMAAAATLRRIGRIKCPFAPGFDRHRISYRWRMNLSENRYPIFGIMRRLTSLVRALNYPLGDLPIGSA